MTGSPMREVLDAYRDADRRPPTCSSASGSSRRRLLPGQRPPRGERRRPRPAQPAARLPRVRRRTTTRPAGARLDPPAHPQAARGAGPRRTEGITFHEPLGFLDYNRLQQQRLLRALRLRHHLRGVRRSSASRRSRCATRSSAPRPSTPASILMTGLDPDNVVEAVGSPSPTTDRASRVPDDYRIGDCSRRTVGFILSTHARHESWLGHPSGPGRLGLAEGGTRLLTGGALHGEVLLPDGDRAPRRSAKSRRRARGRDG